MVAYFFFGPATLYNLEPRLLATALVPLGEATVPDTSAIEWLLEKSKSFP